MVIADDMFSEQTTFAWSTDDICSGEADDISLIADDISFGKENMFLEQKTSYWNRRHLLRPNDIFSEQTDDRQV